MRRNRYDKDHCLERGMSAEKRFCRAVRSYGWKVKKASTYQDAQKHWDFKVTSNKGCYKVDVKAMKKISRRDKAVQDQWTWIELHGVTKEGKGWLYGEADLIAFEVKDGFILIRRTDLNSLVFELVENITVTSPIEAKYRVYSRPNRHDKITLIETSQLNKKDTMFLPCDTHAASVGTGSPTNTE